MDVKCEKKNAVLCEKSQAWSYAKIESIILEMRKSYSDKFVSLQNQISSQNIEQAQLKQSQLNNANLIEKQRIEIDSLKQSKLAQEKQISDLKQGQNNNNNLIGTQRQEIEHLKQTPVPIGFIYVQLPGQNDPQTLWPSTQCNNISPNYAGLFFRAEGGGANAFGAIQEQQTQNIYFITQDCDFNSNCFDKNNEEMMTGNYAPKLIWTGGSDGDDGGLNFRHSTDEIRPRNQAIRIWIRIK